MKDVVLASSSPRRIELVKMLGITDITVIPPYIDETLPFDSTPEDTVCRIALKKAQSASRAAAVVVAEPLIIAADTLVYADGQALGKPVDEEDADRMLHLLSGRCHSVYTGVALICGEKSITFTEKTNVYFRRLSDEEIFNYIATGEPMDKAGAYGAQGFAAAFIERIDGDFWNVVGLPLCRLSVALREL